MAHALALAPEEIDEFTRMRPVCAVTFARAHKFLTECQNRHRKTQNSIYLHDLTDSLEFGWKAWLSQRPDALDIVGPGIISFTFV